VEEHATPASEGKARQPLAAVCTALKRSILAKPVARDLDTQWDTLRALATAYGAALDRVERVPSATGSRRLDNAMRDVDLLIGQMLAYTPQPSDPRELFDRRARVVLRALRTSEQGTGLPDCGGLAAATRPRLHIPNFTG